MRRLAAALLLFCLQVSAWDIGFNFRATSAFVTDPVSTTWAIVGSTPYPTTRTVAGQTITFGWETLSGSYLTRDRSTLADPRLAGINCQLNNGSSVVFRVDLPSTGIYGISLALGDGVGNNNMNNHAKVNSNNTTLITVDRNSVTNFADATGVLLSPTVWSAANTSVQRTFTSTVLRLILGATSDAGNSCISHMRITLIQAGLPTLYAPLRSFYLE